MVNHLLIGQIAGFLALVQIIPYIISILRGHTKPERMSYLIWFIVDLIAISSYIAVGARSTIWAGIVFTFTGFLVLVMSIKHGIGGFSAFDIMCLVAALLGVVIWITSRNALLALYFCTAVNLIGYLPTIKKVYFLPHTENTTSWTLAAIASTLNLFALTTLAPSIALPVALAALEQGLVTCLLLFPHVRFQYSARNPHRVHAFLAHPVFAR